MGSNQLETQMNKIETYMEEAIKEAILSLREGNHGFGAVIVKNNEIIAKAHDLQKAINNPILHAEMNVIRIASRKIGKNLEGCILISTHEPCPVCSRVIMKSGIKYIAYGYTRDASIKKEQRRISLIFEPSFNRIEDRINIDKNILLNKCRIFYNKDVLREIKSLRNITPAKLEFYNQDSINRRLKWFQERKSTFDFISNNLLDSAYKLLLRRFNIDSSEAQMVKKSDSYIVFHSKNFCPTLEACKILGYDTRYICRYYNESSTDTLIKKIDSRLKFVRNYEKIRPYSNFCEEMIFLEKK